MFSRIVVEKRQVTCATTDMCLRRWCTSYSAMSLPSSLMEPRCGLYQRSMRYSDVLLPQPVPPTKPTFSPGAMDQLRSNKTCFNGSEGNVKSTFLNSMAPMNLSGFNFGSDPG